MRCLGKGTERGDRPARDTPIRAAPPHTHTPTHTDLGLSVLTLSGWCPPHLILCSRENKQGVRLPVLGAQAHLSAQVLKVTVSCACPPLEKDG